MTPRRPSRTSQGSQAPALANLPTGPVPTSYATARLERRDSGVLLLLDETESSWIDLRDPGHLDFEYQQQMNAVLQVLTPEPAPLRATHLGGAGCALARAWEARRPGSTQLAVEIDAVLAQYVRQWFDLPRSPRLRIRVADAAQAAPTLRPGEWDVVVRDIFAQGQVPASCRSADFHAACVQALAPDGVYLVNMPSAPRSEAGQDLAALRQVCQGVLVVADPAHARGKRHGNLVAVACQRPWSAQEREQIERAVRRLPLPVRTWQQEDPALPRP